MSILNDFTSSVGKLASAADAFIPDAGDIVEKTCDALLPDEYEYIGDILSGATNIATGNYVAAIADAGDLIEGIKFSEPDPPPAAAERSSSETDVAPRRLPTPVQAQNVGAADVETSSSALSNASGSSSASGASSQNSTEAIQKMNDMSDDAFRNMIRNGEIPPEIAKDPVAMQALQMRMQEMQQMNALMTNLLRSMHEMQMEIVRNIRA